MIGLMGTETFQANFFFCRLDPFFAKALYFRECITFQEREFDFLGKLLSHIFCFFFPLFVFFSFAHSLLFMASMSKIRQCSGSCPIAHVPGHRAELSDCVKLLLTDAMYLKLIYS